MKKVLGQSSFVGGMSVSDEKQGIPNSFLYAQGIDFRKKPSQMSVLPKTVNTATGVIVDLIQDMIQVADGSRYMLGNLGNFYKVATNGIVSNLGKTNTGAAGMIYRRDVDRIIFTGSTTASSYYPISNNPVLELDKYTKSKSTDTACNQETTGTSGSVGVPTTLSEASRRTFTPDIEPMYSIKLFVVAKGTGTVTVTIHDDANNVLGTSSKATGDITSNDWNEWVFTNPIRMLVKPNARILHLHVTSTVNDTTIRTTEANPDVTTCDYQMWANRFISPNNGFHPAIQFQQYCCFGNERYLSVWEPLSDDPSNLEWNRHRLTFPPGYEVCGLALYDEYLAIACELRSSSSTKNFQNGKIFFWDGTSTTYNYFIDVPEGSPYSLYQYKNILYWFAGGAWYGYAGGKPTKIKTFPNTDDEYTDATAYTIGYPNMATVRRGTLLMGFPSETTNQTIKHGVYSWGAVEKNYADSFGYSYIISTGTTNNNGTNNLRLGMIKNFGDTLYISWRDDENTLSASKYGLDIVDNNSDPYASTTWESLIFDNGQTWKQKNALRIIATFKSLPAGATVQLKYKIDRASNWTTGAVVNSGKTTSLHISQGRFYEIQFGIDITSTTTTPEITFVGLEYDDLNKEEFVG